MLLSLLVLLAPAHAAEAGLDAHGFQPPVWDGDLRDPVTLVRPDAFRAGDAFGIAYAELAEKPLVQVVVPDVGDDVRTRPAVDHLATLALGLGVAVHDRVRLEASAPFYVHHSDLSGASRWAAPGDVRLAATTVLLAPPHVEGTTGPSAGLTVHADLPTGAPDAFLGRGGVAGGFRASGGYTTGRLTLTGNAGLQLNPSALADNLTGADNLLLGAAVGVLASDAVALNLEAHVSPALAAADPWGTGSPGEALLSLRHRRADGTFLTLGGGTAITRGAGAAQLRVFLGFGWGDVEPPRPPDQDALAGFAVADLCPAEREVENGWKDDDGCPDTLGALAVEVWWQGERFPEATVRVTGPEVDEERHTGRGSIEYVAPPGSRFRAVATTEACLRGEAEATLGGSATELRVDLEAFTDATVEIEAVDLDGAPIEGAVATFTGGAETCRPTEEVPLDAEGQVAVPVGHGAYAVSVRTPNHGSRQAAFEVMEGETVVLRMEFKPTRVRVEKKQIVILDKVQFEVNKAVIKPESFELLNEVAATIITNPHVGRVEVSGHTDSQGSDRYNQDLSERRAEAVRAYLVGQGVDTERLLAKGYGESVPIADNATEEGRYHNRRVEFVLIDQASEPEEAP